MVDAPCRPALLQRLAWDGLIRHRAGWRTIAVAGLTLTIGVCTASAQPLNGTTVDVVPVDAAAAAVEQVGLAGARIVSLAARGDAVWMLVQREEPARPRRLRLLASPPRDLERQLNAFAADGFRLSGDAPTLEHDGRHWIVLEGADAPADVTYRVSKRVLFRERPILQRPVGATAAAAAEIARHEAEGFRPFLLIGGQVVLERRDGAAGPLTAIAGKVDQVLPQVRTAVAAGQRIALADLDEKGRLLVLLTSFAEPGAQMRLVIADTVLRMQAALRGEAHDGFVLWRRGVVARGGMFLAVTEADDAEPRSYRIVVPDAGAPQRAVSPAERVVSLVHGGAPLLVVETGPSPEPNVTENLRSMKGRKVARTFFDLQFQDSDDLGSRVTLRLPQGKVSGRLVGVTPSAVSIRTGESERVFTSSEVRWIRSKTAARRGVVIGTLAGLGAGIGIYLAADKTCEPLIQDPVGCVVVNTVALWELMGYGMAAGAATGFAVGHVLPGPLLFEPSPIESRALGRGRPSIILTPGADGRGVALRAVVRVR